MIGLLLFLAGVLLLLDDVMNHGVRTHIEAAKYLNILTNSTAYHILAFIEEHSN